MGKRFVSNETSENNNARLSELPIGILPMQIYIIVCSILNIQLIDFSV